MGLPKWVSAMVVLTTVGCGGGGEQRYLPSEPVAASGPAKPGASSGVTGKLAASLAPPSTLVALEPQPSVEVPVKTEPAIMDQAGYQFLPAFLVAQAGQAVQFRNSEDVLHNVRVTEGGEQKPVFNVATLAFGSYEHKFERPGLYDVSCDIHSTMRASILVMDTPYTAATGPDGRFTIDNVPPGHYNLTVYAGAAPVVRPIDVKDGGTDLGVLQ